MRCICSLPHVKVFRRSNSRKRLASHRNRRGLCSNGSERLADNANILTLPKDMGVGQFEAMFAIEKPIDRFKEQAIDWQKVSRQYDGIIIAPYQWEHRLSSDWYYPWDCASGCIWNGKAIQTIVPIDDI